MSWPIYYKDLLKIGNLDSTVGIATGWTICDKIVTDIPKNLYAVAGQLYTKNGINFLVRNLLANKKIRFLLVCGQDRGGSEEEIAKLWSMGDIPSLEKEIDRASVKKMIENVSLINLSGEENISTIMETLTSLDQNLPAYGEREEFPEAKQEEGGELLCHFPTDPSVFKVRGKTVAETWLKILKTVMRFGEVKETDSMKMKEILNLSAVVEAEDPDKFFIPEYLGFDSQKLEAYLPQILTKEKFEGLHYTYGYRLGAHFEIDQIEKIIEKLRLDPNAREALAVLFDPKIDIKAEHRPCIVLVQALRNQGKLNFNVYVRSHDLFGGWPLNAFGLRKLHQKIAKESGLELGSLTLVSASAHIYDFNWQEAEKIVKANDHFVFETDPRGYFEISIDEQKNLILAKHFSPDGHLLKTFEQSVSTPKAALAIGRQISAELSLSLIDHALDLGIELQKAESALRMKKSYVQDQPFLV